MLCAVRLDVIRGCSITYCYSSRCSAETAKINLMVFAYVVYCVVELKSSVICLLDVKPYAGLFRFVRNVLLVLSSP